MTRIAADFKIGDPSEVPPERPGKFMTAGESEFGSSRYTLYMTCPLRAALRYYSPKRTTSLQWLHEAPTLGTLTHAGLAHVYLRQKALQDNEDPAQWMSPNHAIEYEAEREAERSHNPQVALGLVGKAQRLTAAYADHYRRDRFKVLAVEESFTIWLGEDRDNINTPRITCRVDLITEDRNGVVTIWDHKTASRVTGDTLSDYSRSFQFQTLYWIGRIFFGTTNVRINFLEHGRPPFRFSRPPLDPVPQLREAWPKTVRDVYSRIRADRLQYGDKPGSYPAYFGKACHDRYRVCEYYQTHCAR